MDRASAGVVDVYRLVTDFSIWYTVYLNQKYENSFILYAFYNYSILKIFLCITFDLFITLECVSFIYFTAYLCNVHRYLV